MKKTLLIAAAGKAARIDVNPRADVRWQHVVAACAAAQCAGPQETCLLGVPVSVERRPDDQPAGKWAPSPRLVLAVTSPGGPQDPPLHHASAGGWWIGNRRSRPGDVDGAARWVRGHMKAAESQGRDEVTVEVRADRNVCWHPVWTLLRSLYGSVPVRSGETPGGVIRPGPSAPRPSTSKPAAPTTTRPGQAAGGTLAPWGHTTGGAGRGPRSNFFSSGGNAHHVVYAIERAFAVLARADQRRPGMLIYLLTDGNFPDNAAVLATIRKLNVDKKVSINTYLYGRRPPEAEKVMRLIAKENKGRYKYVSADE